MSLESPDKSIVADKYPFSSAPKPKLITKRELATNWAQTIAGAIGTAGLFSVVKISGENALLKSNAQDVINGYEKEAKLELFLTNQQLLPSKLEKANLIDPAKSEIATVAKSLKMSPENVCIDPSLLSRSTTLLRSCQVVSINDSIEMNYQHFLSRTDHSEWVKYEKELGFGDLSVTFGLSVMALLAAVLTVRSTKVSIDKSAEFLRQHMPTNRLLSGSFLGRQNPS